eukprot:184425-Amphidinium_carterae.1
MGTWSMLKCKTVLATFRATHHASGLFKIASQIAHMQTAEAHFTRSQYQAPPHVLPWNAVHAPLL